MKKFIVAAIVVLAWWIVTSYNAQAESTTSNVGYGAGSVLASCVYSPAKVVYALSGGLTGGVAYLLTGGNQEVAKKIWTPSLRGTYVITPDMLKGKEPVQFVGEPETKKSPPPESHIQEDSLGR